MTEDIQAKRFEVEYRHETEGRNTMSESWRDSSGVLNRPLDKPARTVYARDTTQIISETWCKDGEIHRDNDLPAHIEYCERSGRVTAEHWYRNGLQHRDGGRPAAIQRDFDSDTISHEDYAVDGVLHREGDQPALVQRSSNGSPRLVMYYKNGEIHRDPALGPAIFGYNECSTDPEVSYFVDGVEIAPPKKKPTAPSP